MQSAIWTLIRTYEEKIAELGEQVFKTSIIGMAAIGAELQAYSVVINDLKSILYKEGSVDNE